MTLHHRIHGDHGPLVVFAHGLFGQGKNFGMITRQLVDGYRCAVFDMPHHGRSPWEGPITYDAMADVVAEHLRNVHGDDLPVVLVGHSLGGKMAMRLALRHPELLRALMVVDIAPVATSKRHYFERIVGALRGLDLAHLESRTEADAALIRQIPDDTVRAFLLQNLHHNHHDDRWYWQVNLDGIAGAIDTINGWPAISGTFEGPVAWVGGSESDYITDAAAEPMRALFPATRRVTINGAGHWVHSEQPDAFASTLRVFLDGVTSPGRR